MWENLFRVDWARLTHAYGYASDVPKVLHDMVSSDSQTRAAGWDAYWGALNHQGDFYDSTVAVIPFLIEAAANPTTPERDRILISLRDRWQDAPDYGGDPLVPEPPGGVDIATPVRTDAELEMGLASTSIEFEDHEEDEFDTNAYRRMDLCAWQTGRAIQAGRPTFEELLTDSDREVSAAAAQILLMWPESRQHAKRRLVQTINEESAAVERGKYVLEFGVYADNRDLPSLENWIQVDQPDEVRAAAALVWACVIDPAPLPTNVLSTFAETSERGVRAFANLPWVGVYHRGPWDLPSNAAYLILLLAMNENHELRWRAVQGLSEGRATAKFLSDDEVIPVLLNALDDPYNRIRDAAAYALSQRGEAVLATTPSAIPRLIAALAIRPSAKWGDEFSGLDDGAATCGHIARLLAFHSFQLEREQRQQAIELVENAIRHFTGKHATVMFDSMGIDAAPFLKKQLALVREPKAWGLPELLEPFAFPNMQEHRLSRAFCEQRLAERVSQDPKAIVAEAIEVVENTDSRNSALGAVHWLMSLGPAAAPALDAIDRMASGDLDRYAKDEAKSAAAFIRESLSFEPDTLADASARSVRQRVANLVYAQATSHSALLTELQVLLDDQDPYVSAGTADFLRSKPELISPGMIRSLERMLTCEVAVEVGIPGIFDLDGHIYHWRRERRSPRASAVSALFAMDVFQMGEHYLQAMLSECVYAEIVVAQRTISRRFSIAQWRKAAAAAGGLSIAEPQIRRVRQSCREMAWQGDTAAFAAEFELAQVIRQLSGRLI